MAKSSVETQDSAEGRRARGGEGGPAARARLVLVHPRGLACVIDLGAGRCVVGRELERDGGSMLAHPTISRAHLAIEWDLECGVHVAADLGSRNGSRIDGVPIGSAWSSLRAGSVLRLGDVLFVYEPGHTLAQSDSRAVSRDAVPGAALAMKKLRLELARAAVDVSPVLISGETGTGKELIAAELHRLSGRRGAFVAVNCATLGQELITSQLFGHVKGTFTGAVQDQPGLFKSAEGGTLFLDELGELPLELQPKLLRAIQEREVFAVGGTRAERVDVRVVAATHRPLEQSVERGELRRDLYARLALWELRVPALRDRRVDLLAWIDRFDARFRSEQAASASNTSGTSQTAGASQNAGAGHTTGGEVRARPLELEASAAELVLNAPWKENLRGLDRLVRKLAEPARSGAVRREDLPAWIAGGGA